MNLPTLTDIKEAKNRLNGSVHHTPIFTSHTLDHLCSGKIFLKAENLQKTGSFKVRGALNTLLQLKPDELARGVIAVSAGNHAGGVAWAAREVGTKATIVMPATASKVKVAATKGYGAEVVLFGNSTVEAFAEMERIRNERKLILVHPFDDPRIVCGAGTIGIEIIEEINDADNIFVPIGGGGLISGVAIAAKALARGVSIIGSEPTGADAMARSLSLGHPVKLEKVDSIADGLAAPYVTELTYTAVKNFVDDVILVTDTEIKHAMKFLLERCKLLVEPAGAAALAPLLFGKYKCKPNSKTVLLLSGGNADLRLIAELSSRDQE